MAINKSILIFGTGILQQSIIERCKLKSLFTVGIDPNPNAECKDFVDVFEVIAGDNFSGTLAVVNKYNVSGIITAATDKPLVMMAKVAKELNLPFYSENTAVISTDKLLMKQQFIENEIPCAKGFKINNISELNEQDISFPVIVKPRDNSGSRGVIYCKDIINTKKAIIEAFQFTKKGNVLIEEFIEGKEYSVEGIHYDGEHQVIQVTEKITTQFPYNVELGHLQPANITKEQSKQINNLIKRVGNALGFENCASHTEIKFNSKGIFVIESSPRLGGDFISSTLVPLSTGINMEDILIDIATNNQIEPNYFISKFNKASCIKYFELIPGEIKKINKIEKISNITGIQKWFFALKQGDIIPIITSSLSRYGYAIFQTDTTKELYESLDNFIDLINKEITIDEK